MFGQILQVFNFSNVDTSTIVDEKEYDPFKRPPNFNLAQQHKAASKFSLPKENDAKAKICPCCGYAVITEEMNMCCSRYDLNFNGAGYPLYFEFLVFAVCFTTVLGLISGVYTTIQNSMGNRCEIVHSEQCNDNYYNTFSLSNRTGKLEESQCIIDLIATIVMIASTVLYRRIQNLSSAELQNAYIAISDYSVQVNNLPKDATEEEIKKFFGEIIKNDQPKILDIRKITMTYNIHEYNQLLEERMKKKYILFNTSINQQDNLDELEQELQKIEDQIKMYEEFPEQNFKFSGVAFITYNKSSNARAIRKYYQLTRLGMMLHKIFVIFQNKDYQQFRNKIIFVERAPEPGDVQWENLGINPWKQWRYQQLTNIITILLLLICFGVIFGISYGQEAINSTESGQTTSYGVAIAITILGVLSSLSISLINMSLGIALRQLVNYEKPQTLTEFNTSVAIKLGVSQFLNTAIIPLLVNLALAQGNYLDRIWTNGGLNSDISLVLIVNAFFSPIISYFDPYYFYLLYLESHLTKQGEQCQRNQKEINEIFEGPYCDLSKKYAVIAKTLLVTCFYAPLLPLGIPFAILSFLCIYWVEKFLLLKRYSRGPPIGEGLPDEMVDFFVEMTILAFASGNCIWQRLVYGEIHILTWIQLAISAFAYFVPLGMVFERIINVGEVKIKQTYEESRKNIWDDYPRRNPLTMNKAMDEWIKELQMEEQQMIQNQEGKSPNKNFFKQLTRKLVDVNKIKKLQKLRQAQQQSKVIQNVNQKTQRHMRSGNKVIPTKNRQAQMQARQHPKTGPQKPTLKIALKKANNDYLQVPSNHVQVINNVSNDKVGELQIPDA